MYLIWTYLGKPHCGAISMHLNLLQEVHDGCKSLLKRAMNLQTSICCFCVKTDQTEWVYRITIYQYIHILHVYTENTGPPAAEGKASGRNERSMKIYTSLRSMKIYTSLKKNDKHISCDSCD